MRLRIVAKESRDPGPGHATLGRLVKRAMAQENAANEQALDGDSQRRNPKPPTKEVKGE